MRPVSTEYGITQGFASYPTRGVVGNIRGSEVQVLVALYGHYQEDGHAGTDIGCPVGTPVRAARSGTVIYCNWDVNLPGGPNDWAARWFFYQRFGGRLLLIQHAPDDIDVYAHLSEFKVQRGQFVNEGDLVALSGDSSGGQDGQLGPHLHCERIVDLSYPTGNGLIYGRTNPTTVWGNNGGIAAQGTITEEDDFLATLSDAEKDTLFQTLDKINERVAKLPPDDDYWANLVQAVARIDLSAKEGPGKQYWADLINAMARVDANAATQSDPKALADAIATALPKENADALLNALSERLAK